jgi:hypothetical protein
MSSGTRNFRRVHHCSTVFPILRTSDLPILGPVPALTSTGLSLAAISPQFASSGTPQNVVAVSGEHFSEASPINPSTSCTTGPLGLGPSAPRFPDSPVRSRGPFQLESTGCAISGRLASIISPSFPPKVPPIGRRRPGVRQIRCVYIDGEPSVLVDWSITQLTSLRTRIQELQSLQHREVRSDPSPIILPDPM